MLYLSPGKSRAFPGTTYQPWYPANRPLSSWPIELLPEMNEAVLNDGRDRHDQALLICHQQIHQRMSHDHEKSQNLGASLVTFR